jgi:hypothetical protein
MKQQYTVPCLVLAGFILLGVGMAWPRIMPSSAYWGPDQAKEYNTAKFELHEKSHHHTPSKAHDDEFARAQERFNKISRELERAQGSRHFTGTLFTITGTIFLIAGIGAYFATQKSA